MNILVWALPLGVFVSTLLVGLILAPYFMSKRVERGDFHFEFNSHSMTTTDNRLFLGVTFISSTDMIVENLYLELNNERFQPTNWVPFRLKRIHSENYAFDLGKVKASTSSGSQDAKFLAIVDHIVNSVEHESSPFKIHTLL